jgi:hypothetical protein
LVRALHVLWAIADLKADMIKPGLWMSTLARFAADFEQEHLMMRPSGRKNCCPRHATNFRKPKSVSIKIRGAFKAAHEEDNVSKFFNGHREGVRKRPKALR